MRNNLSVGGSAIGIRKVRRYLQTAIAAELLLPVHELLFDFGTPCHLLLPDDVVGKVHGNGRKGVRYSLRESGVKLLQFFHDQTDGPSIANDLMNGEGQDVALILHANQAHTNQGIVRKIEGSPGFFE